MRVPNEMTRPFFNLLVCLLLLVPACRSQTAVPQFDVVSIKLNPSGAPSGSISMEPDRDRVMIVNAPMYRIVEFAFNLRRYQLLTGAPAWARTERYDLIAKVAAADLPAYARLSDSDRRGMLRSMLAERCSLRAHLQPAEMPVYLLTIARSGLKIHPVPPGTSRTGPVLGPDGRATAEEDLRSSPGLLEGHGISMASLALALSAQDLGRPVVERTGLQAVFDLTLQWTPEAPEATAVDDPAAVSPFRAIEEQLGLKLMAGRAPVDQLVVERLAKPTSD